MRLFVKQATRWNRMVANYVLLTFLTNLVSREASIDYMAIRI